MNSSPYDLERAAIALRCFGCLVSLPLGEALSTFPRFLLSVGLSLVIFPSGTRVDHLPLSSLITEFVIGFVLGAPLRFVADVSEMIGELIDTARGQMIAAVLDPLQGHGTSDMAVLAKSASVVVALMCGGVEIVMSALAKSFVAIPIGSPAHDPSLLQGVARSGAFLLTEGMRLCAVWVGAFLLIDMTCAFLSRVVSGLAFTQTAAILKMLVLFLLLVAMIVEGIPCSRDAFWHVVAPWEWWAGVGTGGGGFGELLGLPEGLK